MKYFQSKTALSIEAMEDIVEAAAQESTVSEQVQKMLEGIAGYMICDILETVAELHEQGTLNSVDDVCRYLYHLFDQ